MLFSVDKLVRLVHFKVGKNLFLFQLMGAKYGKSGEGVHFPPATRIRQ